jgi:hypothetical protein
MSESEHIVDRAEEILPRQVGILYENGLFLLLANVASAGIVTAILGPELGRSAYLWFAAIVVAALLRGALILAYRRKLQLLPVSSWAGLFTLGAMVSGIVWGLACSCRKIFWRSL